MPRKRGKDSRKSRRSTGTQLEQAPDPVASSRARPAQQSKRQKQRDSEIAAATPYGDYRARRKTS